MCICSVVSFQIMCLFSRFVFFSLLANHWGFCLLGFFFFANVVPDLNFFLENVTLCDTCFKSNGHIAVGSHFLCKHPPKHIHPPFWGKPNAEIAKTPTRFGFFFDSFRLHHFAQPWGHATPCNFFFLCMGGGRCFFGEKKTLGWKA